MNDSVSSTSSAVKPQKDKETTSQTILQPSKNKLKKVVLPPLALDKEFIVYLLFLSFQYV